MIITCGHAKITGQLQTSWKANSKCFWLLLGIKISNGGSPLCHQPPGPIRRPLTHQSLFWLVGKDLDKKFCQHKTFSATYPCLLLCAFSSHSILLLLPYLDPKSKLISIWFRILHNLMIADGLVGGSSITWQSASWQRWDTADHMVVVVVVWCGGDGGWW